MENVEQALKAYLKDWEEWCEHEEFVFSKLQPMHAGWKVADEAALGEQLAQLLAFARQGHIGTVDNRKIVLLLLKKPIRRIPVLQLMQRRPGSSDLLGLDHVAFYCKDMDALERILKSSGYKWEHQSNPGHRWISLWFGAKQREVKFFDHTALDLGARELSEASDIIKTT